MSKSNSLMMSKAVTRGSWTPERLCSDLPETRKICGHKPISSIPRIRIIAHQPGFEFTAIPPTGSLLSFPPPTDRPAHCNYIFFEVRSGPLADCPDWVSSCNGSDRTGCSGCSVGACVGPGTSVPFGRRSGGGVPGCPHHWGRGNRGSLKMTFPYSDVSLVFG